jgi:phosphatidate cytidylyltransferase
MDGKKLAKRTVFGVLFLVVVIGGMLTPWSFAALTVLLGVILSEEFFRMTLGSRYRRERACIIAAIVATTLLGVLAPLLGFDVRWMMVGLLPVFAASILLLFDCAKSHDFPTALYFPLVYVMLPLLAAQLLTRPVDGTFTWRLLLGIFVLMWCNDVGAYVVGMSFGQRPNSRKLFPALSPKKSWIGVVGGTAFSFLGAWVVFTTFGGTVLPLVHWMPLALITSVFGVLGDLFESLIKRHAQVKDASNLIPGHGGLLDRFDDVLFVLPLAAIYLQIVQLL